MPKKDFLKDMKKAGPATDPMMEAEDQDLEGLDEMELGGEEMPTEEPEAEYDDYPLEDVSSLYEENPEFRAEVNPLVSKYMEEGAPEEGDEYSEEGPEEEAEEEDLFA